MLWMRTGAMPPQCIVATPPSSASVKLPSSWSPFLCFNGKSPLPLPAKLIVTRPQFGFRTVELVGRQHRIAREQYLLYQCRMHLGGCLAPRGVVVAVEVLAAIDPCLVTARSNRQRRAIPHHDIRVLARL